MKKKLIYILLGCTLAQGFTACDTVDFGDTNENLNGPKKVYPAGLMSGAMMSFATTTGRSNLLVPTLLVQYQSQVTYTDEMLYAESPYSWAEYYNNMLPALNLVIKYNQDEKNHTSELLAQGAPENQIGVAMIMKAIVMKRVTDTWGDAPYSEALKGIENLTPTYDKQEDIYRSLIAELKQGRDMLDATKASPIGDIIYDGNVTKWKKLANSVLLQMTLQLSETPIVDFAKTEFNAALADPNGVIDEISEEAWFKYDKVVEFNNPYTPNRAADYFLSGEFVDAMQGDAPGSSLNPTSNHTPDGRLAIFAVNTTREGVPYGYSDESGSGKNQMNKNYFWNNMAPLPMMTASYTYLNRAEAAALGWTTEVATDMLTKGITMSFETLEAHALPKANTLTAAEVTKVSAVSEKGPAYAAARVADAATVGILQVIGEEKWKSLFPQGFDAWAEWRRTGYPELTPATDAVNSGAIPTRYLYPTEEATVNGANSKTGISTLSPATDKNDSKVWWDQ
ncbi:SusD/RagB family nutrient-binding outer membrane lipoprotein [Pontibacter fetidus]|uniref:SusD/RagB family nutrient-binding outer membrane lipoprotein n=1 Tax=Pontibacter fetidus TaxID=2700082 RepID=A0A6B2HBA7_9BACT|nr:SusD/RagB family nutrient-binding outer membrane lipoprotein [Pontibacter fetidus]NDK56864.1 SusD/RagB family nutrient-binding outer membrane lipoprotein [Pontibacter fetidus]